MKDFFKKIKSDRIISAYAQISTILTIITISYTTFFYNRLPPLLPLFNQLPWGDARIGNKYQLFIPVIISLIIFLLNSIIAIIYYEKTPLLSRMLIFTVFIICFLVLLFTIRTIHLVI
ncbi:hypothetical protein LBMAG33_6240 [Candidatus Levyibacteriota bacterium]|nr:hypothetical protein [Candidatus Levybacteria bacterium]MSU25774.1 hypothetical protein [Candidatus Levybacteria bacterium]GDX62314.1 hypothetical protein LBMAG33_6240 [Candidatus Levybacteria bacterium]